MRLPHSTKITAQQILDERAAGEPAEGEAMMHEARKGNFLTRCSSSERTPRISEKEFLADVLRPFHGAIVKALGSHRCTRPIASLKLWRSFSMIQY
jgi:hypothetical protein